MARGARAGVSGISSVVSLLSGHACQPGSSRDTLQDSDTHPHSNNRLQRRLSSNKSTILQLKYSQMLRSAPLIRTSSYALAICLVYSGCFLFYTPSGKRNDFWKLVMRTTLLAGGALLYAGFENPGRVKDRFGLLVTILTLSYIGLPLLKLREVFRNKSSEGLPLPVILASTGASVLWLLYGIIMHNYFIIVQKVIALGLCAVQLSLFVIYPAPAATAAAVRAQHKKPKGE